MFCFHPHNFEIPNSSVDSQGPCECSDCEFELEREEVEQLLQLNVNSEDLGPVCNWL